MRTPTMRIAGTALLGGLLLGASACSSQPLAKEPGTVATDPSSSAQAEPAAASQTTEAQDDAGPEGPATRPVKQVAKDVGTRAHPLPAGTPIDDGDWTVTLGEPYDGWSKIHAEDPYSEPPQEGTEYWLVPVTVTYTGTDPAEPWLDLQFGFVSEENRSYEDWCPVIVPDDLMEVDALYTDATVEANVCLQVPAEATGLWTVGNYWGEKTFVSGQAGEGDE